LSNLIFARRLIQRVILETRQSLGVGPSEQIMERINLQDSNSLAAMWELIILHALSSAGDLQYEVALSNHRRPDFEIAIDGTKFIGDVATVSDDGSDNLNPAEPVREAITRSARKHGVNPNKLSIKIGGHLRGKQGKTRMLLSLPHRSEIGELIAKKVTDFFLSIKNEPEKTASTGIDANATRIVISYEPLNKFQIMSFPSYTTAFSRIANPIWNKLHEKAK
jgi:hypothetical protein